MKLLALTLLWICLSDSPAWQTDYKIAQQQAIKTHKLLLINFSGSDWCLPCIRLKKDVFEKETFLQYASTNLVLMNADFPRKSKSKSPAEITKQNEALAEKYNPGGIFPLTLLMTPEGKELRRWEGNTTSDANQFTDEIKKAAETWMPN